MQRIVPLLLALTFVVPACQRQTRVALPSSGGADAERLFAQAESAFWAGEYQTAAGGYEQILAIRAEPFRERSMFRLALLERLQEGTTSGELPAENYGDRLAREYPDSALNAELDTMLGVLREIGRLRTETRQQESETLELGQELERIRDERARFESEFERVGSELARIRDERAAFEDVLDSALPDDRPSRTDDTNRTSDQTSASPDPVGADLARLGDDLVRLSRDYAGTPLASEAELMLSLLSEVQQLRETRATQVDRINGLISEVQMLRQELDKLREADLRRRVPN